MYKVLDYSKITDDEEVIKLLKEREEIEEKIRERDNLAIIKYEMCMLEIEGEEENG